MPFVLPIFFRIQNILRITTSSSFSNFFFLPFLLWRARTGIRRKWGRGELRGRAPQGAIPAVPQGQGEVLVIFQSVWSHRPRGLRSEHVQGTSGASTGWFVLRVVLRIILTLLTLCCVLNRSLICRWRKSLFFFSHFWCPSFVEGKKVFDHH